MIFGPISVTLFDAVMNLKFVSMRRSLFGPFHRTKENSTVQFVAVRDRIKLQHEVSSGHFRLEKSSAIQDLNRFLFHRELTLRAGNIMPAIQRLAIKQGLGPQGFQKQIAKLDLATFHLQTDMPRF